MSRDGRTTSMFRPAGGVDQAALAANAELLERVQRRGVIKGALSLGAIAMLTGCDVTKVRVVQTALEGISVLNDRVQALLFDPNKLAPTYSESLVLKPPRFNAFYPIDKVKPVDPVGWKLEVGGLVQRKQPWTLQEIYALPEVEVIARHICVEGWDYIGQWSGVNLKLFLEQVGADLNARYVAFRCHDGYYGSIDMATALHPQTQLTTKYAREIVADPFGYPLRLRTTTKLGFKNPKWITSMEVTNDYPGGYWEDRGFNWFSGI